MVEEACASSTYDDYGTKEVDGKMRINGPGVDASADAAGMIMGGGKWPGRLSQYCSSLIEEHGEDGLYTIFRAHKDMKQFLCAKDCAPEPKKKSKKKKKKKKKGKKPTAAGASKDEL